MYSRRVSEVVTRPGRGPHAFANRDRAFPNRDLGRVLRPVSFLPGLQTAHGNLALGVSPRLPAALRGVKLAGPVQDPAFASRLGCRLTGAALSPRVEDPM